MTDPSLQHPSVLLVCASLRAGGTERQLCWLASALAEAGHKVTLLCLAGTEPPAYPLASSVTLLHYAPLSFGRLLSASRQLAAEAKRHDLVLSFLDLPNALASLLVPADKLLWNLRTNGVPERRRSRAYFRLARFRSASIRLAIGNSPAVVEFYTQAGFRCERFGVVANALEAARFYPSDERRRHARETLGLSADDWVLGCVARDHPDKRHDLFFDALLALPRAQAICIGDQVGTSERLRQLISERGLEHRVQLLDASQEIETLLPAFDVGVCCSDREGSPNSLLELLASGVPCVGTRVGGIPALLEDVGLLVDAGDTKALVAALSTLEEPETRAALHAKGLARIAEHHDEAAALARWRTLLGEAFKTQASRQP